MTGALRITLRCDNTNDTPDNEKLAKIRAAEADNLVLAVSEQLDCACKEFGTAADRVL